MINKVQYELLLKHGWICLTFIFFQHQKPYEAPDWRVFFFFFFFFKSLGEIGSNWILISYCWDFVHANFSDAWTCLIYVIKEKLPKKKRKEEKLKKVCLTNWNLFLLCKLATNCAKFVSYGTLSGQLIFVCVSD